MLDGLSNDARTCQEEIFGPVGVVLPYRDEDELIAQANDTIFGLACAIWTRDYRRAWRVARRIDAGTVWINTYKQFSITTPFSGMKASGVGTDKDRDAILQYTRQKSLYWGLVRPPGVDAWRSNSRSHVSVPRWGRPLGRSVLIQRRVSAGSITSSSSKVVAARNARPRS